MIPTTITLPMITNRREYTDAGDERNLLGIRLPVLRKIAREIAAGDWRTYLAEAEDFYFEERMLQGLVIGCARCTPAEKLEYVARFVPKIDNWAVCDCFCWRLKAAERQRRKRASASRF